jgi:hypothetical protein
MDDAVVSVTEGFVKQRRNLVAASLALIFYHTSGLVLEKLEIFGNTLNVRDPWLVSVVLWVAFGYFFLRYYQLFRDLGDKGIRSEYAGRLQSIVTRVAERKLRESYRSMDFGPSSQDIELKDINIAAIRKDRNQWEFRATESKASHTARSLRPDPLQPPMLYVKGRSLRLAKVRAAFHVAFNTRLLTEYYLPFLVAAIPVLVAVWKRYFGPA